MNAQTMDRQATIGDLATLAPKSNVVPYSAPVAPKAYPPKIAKALLAVSREIGAVTKDGLNKFHNYNYQKWEDVLNGISPLLTDHGLIIQQSEVGRCLFENEQLMSITYDFTIINEDGDVWPDRPVWTAISRARDQKGIPDDKAANKAHTQAHKYFLLHLFKIKTAETVAEDSDGDEPKKAAAPKPPKPGSTEAAALEGPRAITGTGPTAEGWADAFLKAIEKATPDETTKWIEINSGAIAKLQAFPDVAAKVAAAIKARAPAPPKPPRPGAPQAAVTAPTVPDPNTDAPGWIKWLGEKMAGFDTYEAGENYWNDKIEALDLDRAVQEDAMSVWQRFTERFEP